nr:MAG TPA: hypothetical protein [Caudoviricetes sp.]
MTSFDTVIDSALAIIDDYKLRKLYNQDVDLFKARIDSLLIQSLPQFWQCRQSLDYNAENREFNSSLTPQEIYILACFWIIAWWEYETNNAAQIALKLGLKNQYSYNSESQNFKEKGNIIDKLREEVDRAITNYLLQSLDDYQY